MKENKKSKIPLKNIDDLVDDLKLDELNMVATKAHGHSGAVLQS